TQVRHGLIPAVRLGRQWMFRDSTLVQIMNHGLPDAWASGPQSQVERTEAIEVGAQQLADQPATANEAKRTPARPSTAGESVRRPQERRDRVAVPSKAARPELRCRPRFRGFPP